MRILITGACGFVGSTLAFRLKEALPGGELIGLDNLVRAGSELNRAGLRRRGIRLVHGDIRNPSDLETLPHCDWILDAAANPSVLAGVDGKTSSRQLVEHNLIGTVNLLELARNWRCGFLMLSTSRVYSIRELAAIPVEAKGGRFEPSLAPPLSHREGGGASRAGEGASPVGAMVVGGLSSRGVTEDFPTEPPLSLYGSTKLASEVLALEYGHSFGFPVWINRCGVLAGAGQFGRPDQGIFSFWIHSWLHGKPLKYIGFDGTGHQVRDCLHPHDLVPVLTKQMNGGADVRKIVNLGGGLKNSFSLAQLSAWCAARFGPRDVEREFARRPFDVPWLILDSSLAERLWDFGLTMPLDAILDEIAAHAREHPDWLELSAS